MKYFWLVLVLLIIVLAWQLWPAPEVVPPAVSDEVGIGDQTPPDSATPPPESAKTDDNTVTYLDNGYQPKELTVKVGTTVFFQNGSISPLWTASAMHPTHKVYPGSDIAKCGTTEATTIFDSCRNLSPGESWSFTFTQVGRWNYHNHSNPSHFGTIVVAN